MHPDLVINPFLQFQPLIGEDLRFLLIAPKPGEGLIRLHVHRSESPKLFDLFSELSKTRLDLLDPKIDLSEDDRTFLFANGVLIESETKLDKPLFSYDLDSTDPYEGAFIAEDLILNPTFRYQPLDLTSFNYISLKLHQSPFKPTIWIRSPFSKAEIGFWLSNEQASFLLNFLSGKHTISNADEALVRKLIAANILVTPDSLAIQNTSSQNKINEAKNSFAGKQYAVMRELFPHGYMRAMRDFYRQYVDNGFMPFGDTQVGLRYREHNEAFASYLHLQFAELMSIVVGKKVKPSYVYAASYKEDSILDPHTDREQCEYSISFQVDYQPEPQGHISPWPIYLEPLGKYRTTMSERGHMLSWDELSNDKQEPLHLASGDGLIYKGRELVHYRYALPKGHRSTSLFFHYVAEDFEGKLD